MNDQSQNGFAMLRGKTKSDMITKLPVYLGRKHNQKGGLDDGQFFAISDQKNISRKHLKITFEQYPRPNDPDNCSWFLYCFGKNGITVNDSYFNPIENPWTEMESVDGKGKKCCKVPLEDKTRIQAGDEVFYFCLPDEYQD